LYLPLSGVSSLAELAQDSFASHYQSFMSGLKGILQSPAAAQMPTLRDQAMQAVGVIGGSVGRETFLPDAREVRMSDSKRCCIWHSLTMLFSPHHDKVMSLLANELQNSTPGSLSIEYVFPATGHICRTLKQDFLAYLPLLIPFLRHTLSTPVDFAVEDVDEDEAVSVSDT